MADLERARADLAVFADIVGRPLTPWQADALSLESRTTTIVAPRQSGKSRSLAVLALHRAFRAPGQRVLIVSAGEEAAKRLLAEVRSIAVGSPLLRGSVVDELASLVTLTNGSEIRSVPASERQIRGWSKRSARRRRPSPPDRKTPCPAGARNAARACAPSRLPARRSGRSGRPATPASRSPHATSGPCRPPQLLPCNFLIVRSPSRCAS